MYLSAWFPVNQDFPFENLERGILDIIVWFLPASHIEIIIFYNGTTENRYREHRPVQNILLQFLFSKNFKVESVMFGLMHFECGNILYCMNFNLKRIFICIVNFSDTNLKPLQC